MNEHTRNRIAGAVILASLAVIFLPMLFDGAGIEGREVPRMPATEGLDSAAVERIDTEASEWAFVNEVERRRADPAGGDVIGLPRHLPVPDAEVEAAVAGDAPMFDAEGTPAAWSVQVASFAERENAQRLRSQLVADGFEAYLNPSAGEGGGLYRVLVGPRLDLGAVRRLRDELAVRYDLEAGMIVRFSIARAAGLDADSE